MKNIKKILKKNNAAQFFKVIQITLTHTHTFNTPNVHI